MTPICLINPPSAFLIDSRVFVSLGILRVASSLEAAGHTVEHLDLNGIDEFVETVKTHAMHTSAIHFGITATTPQMPAVTQIADAIRYVRPDAKIILGGPHATLVNAARKREAKTGNARRAHEAFDKLTEHFDVIVAGDGEDAVFHAIMPDAPRLIDADDAASALFLTNDRYDSLPFPARHLVDIDSYNYSIDGVRALSILGQMACPYQCTFCGGRNSPMLRRIRTRTVDNILSELRSLYETYGVTAWMHYDDELNVSRLMVEFMRGMADLQKELGVEFKQRGFIKSNLFTDEQAEAMYDAGFRWILVGFESGSPRILDNIQKKATVEQNSRCMAIARKHGLKVKALMSIGHAGETAETIRETKEWLLAEKPADFDATIITVYPGCPYGDEAVDHATLPGCLTYTAPRSGDRLHYHNIDFTKETAFYKGALEEYQSFVFTDELSENDIVRLRDDLERDVRAKLGIPFNSAQPGIRYEHSMAASGPLPQNILRTSKELACV